MLIKIVFEIQSAKSKNSDCVSKDWLIRVAKLSEVDRAKHHQKLSLPHDVCWGWSRALLVCLS